MTFAKVFVTYASAVNLFCDCNYRFPDSFNLSWKFLMILLLSLSKVVVINNFSVI